MRDPECVALLQWLLPRLEMRWLGFRKVRRQVCKRIDRRLRELERPRQDIRQQMPEGPFHLILCRHVVLTYFAESLQRRVLTAMLERLIPAGIFVTGKQESLPSAMGGLLACGMRMGNYRRVSSGDV